MRELKFRAWDKKRKCYAKHIMTTNTSCPYHDRMNMFRGVMTFAKWVLHRYAIEQYTGLKDKNGKEIYEGDIVKGGWLYGKNWQVVKYQNYGFYPFTITDFDGDPMIRTVDIEVIGNIHENPELLEKEENE